jgi:hypothetical protein
MVNRLENAFRPPPWGARAGFGAWVCDIKVETNDRPLPSRDRKGAVLLGRLNARRRQIVPWARVLVQPEVERGRSPLVSIPPCGRGFFRHRGLPIRCGFLKSAEAKPPRSVHRLDEPTGLSLSMVASPQCRFRFARQNHCSAAATSAANFRMRRITGANRADPLKFNAGTEPRRE